MDNIYTQKILKPLNKAALLAICAANGIEADDKVKNDDLIALILAKKCPLPEDANIKTDADGEDEAALNAVDGDETEDESVPKFSKEQLLKSNWYSHRRDALNVLLEDGKMYSHATVERLIENFMKGKVK